jgi:hypothetical protein
MRIQKYLLRVKAKMVVVKAKETINKQEISIKTCIQEKQE